MYIVDRKTPRLGVCRPLSQPQRGEGGGHHPNHLPTRRAVLSVATNTGNQRESSKRGQFLGQRHRPEDKHGLPLTSRPHIMFGAGSSILSL